MKFPCAGVAGTVAFEKIAGAAAEAGAGLAGCKRLGGRTNACTASMGVGLGNCTVHAAGVPTFEIGAGEIEMGVGIHGEPGRRRALNKPARRIVDDLLDAISSDLSPPHTPGSHCCRLSKDLVEPFYENLFRSMLMRFLLEMGITASRQIKGFWKVGPFMAGFGVIVPVVHGLVGVSLAHLAGLSVGGTFVFGAICASASFIDAPAA